MRDMADDAEMPKKRVCEADGREWSALELLLLGAAVTTGDPKYQDAAIAVHFAIHGYPVKAK